jgi:hypothetical protein
MNTVKLWVDGIFLIVPDTLTEWPYESLAKTPNCCGPGQGLLEKVVPDKILGLSFSPVCYTHDY